MDKIPVSAMVFTLDEEVNLPFCLESLKAFEDVIVVDSFSTDSTKKIAEKQGARFFQHAFTGFGDQRNWAMDHTAPRHDWVLILDADERVPEALAREIAAAVASAGPDVAAFRLKRRFFMWGKWLRYSSLYPNWVVRLVRRDRVRYINRGHAETQSVNGRIVALREDLMDENKKPLSHWFERQARYAEKEAAFELQPDQGSARFFSIDPLKRRAALKRITRGLPLRPFLYFFYAYVVRGGFLDGVEGWRFCRMKASYQAMIVRHKRALARKRDA